MVFCQELKINRNQNKAASLQLILENSSIYFPISILYLIKNKGKYDIIAEYSINNK
jgi:hypothetical protein